MGNDTIITGSGNDTITAGAWSGPGNVADAHDDDVVFAGAGDDVVYGQGGNDILFGEAGNDKLYGGVGNDELNGGTGDDLLVGGEGSDVYVFGLGEGWDTIVETTDANPNQDIIYLAGMTFDQFYGSYKQGNNLLIQMYHPNYGETIIEIKDYYIIDDTVEIVYMGGLNMGYYIEGFAENAIEIPEANAAAAAMSTMSTNDMLSSLNHSAPAEVNMDDYVVAADDFMLQ